MASLTSQLPLSTERVAEADFWDGFESCLALKAEVEEIGNAQQRAASMGATGGGMNVQTWIDEEWLWSTQSYEMSRARRESAGGEDTSVWRISFGKKNLVSLVKGAQVFRQSEQEKLKRESATIFWRVQQHFFVRLLLSSFSPLLHEFDSVPFFPQSSSQNGTFPFFPQDFEYFSQ